MERRRPALLGLRIGDFNDDSDEEVIVSNGYSRTASPPIGIQQAIIAQPIVLLNDIHSIELASEIVIAENPNDVDDVVSIASSTTNSSASGSRASSSRESSPIPTLEEQEDSTEAVSKKRSRSESEHEDDGQICPICLDNWTSSGCHRICSLKCGHLFGHSCISRWLLSQPKKSCPTCKKKVMKNDIRFIYAKKLISVDTSELDEIKEKLDNVIDERNKIQLELSKYICREHSLNQEINHLKSQLVTFKNNPMLFSTSNNTMINLNQSSAKIQLYMEKSLDICPLGGCRVFDANPGLDLIMANVKASSGLFAGFGLRKISISQYRPLAFLPLHSGQIRDICFQNIKVLTVSMDKTFKMTDCASNSNICSVTEMMPLWSCCWDSVNNNCFYLGTQIGSVIKYDIRNVSQCLGIFGIPGDMSPVVSVAHIPSEPGSLPHDGIVSCKLNSLWFFEDDPASYNRHPLAVDGPFYSMKFDPICRQLLVSSRPNQRSNNSRHTLANLQIDDGKVNVNCIHTFESAGLQKYLSRSCFIRGENEYIAAHEESSKLVNLWNINSGSKATSVPAHDPVLDLNSITTGRNNFLVGLTERKLLFYKFV